VEAKEGVKIKDENQTLATITLQNYFRLYDKLAGMTGTAETEAAEFHGTYGLHVVPIPTNRPLARDDRDDVIYRSEEAKFDSVADDLAERYEVGQPVLVGTISVEKSEKLGRLLDQRGIPHEVLNAKQHAREADIVAQAGRLHSVTVATNMAGRGVDIILGGNPEALAHRDLTAEGLDASTDEGEARLADLLAKYEPECAEEGNVVRELGGLYVLATERHDSRRIDNQLRGRSGRQGDPGVSRFYISLEDELMRIFATGAMNWVMGKSLPDDTPIESKMVTKAVERAQNTVEQKNAESRKRVLEYDEVMNEQRKVIYKRRDQILDGANLRDEALEYLADAIDSTIRASCISENAEDWDLDTLLSEVANLWPSELTADDLVAADSTDEIYDVLMSEATAVYEARESDIGEEAMRAIERQVMLRIIDQRWREHLYEMDYLKDGIHLRAMGQKDPLTEWQREGFEMFGAMMDNIARDFVTYVMRVQVKIEEKAAAGSDGGEADGTADATGVTESGPVEPSRAPTTAARATEQAAARVAEETGPKLIEENQQASHTPVVKSDWDKTPRNAPCPCGSGKKFKHCHGGG
jgi:preprotein translocase subunit SecA